MRKLKVKGIEFRSVQEDANNDFICISDLAHSYAKKNDAKGEDLVRNWIRNKNTLDFLGVWEQINNVNFNLVEFHQIKTEAGLNRFLMSAKKWVERTNAIGLYAKTGRYGSGTFAHYDIALEFASWLSPELKLYIIKEFQRLKHAEAQRANIEWKTNRFLAKVNYRLQTNAIRNILLPILDITKKHEAFVYADEADIVNYAMFGKTAKQWKQENPNAKKEENIRDYAHKTELAILSNLEHKNAELIKEGVGKKERLQMLIKQANEEKQILINDLSLPKNTLPLDNDTKK
jgi:KilA-N domain